MGDYISKGQLLYEIYSEDLNAAQHEYILSIQNGGNSNRFTEAAKNKLLLYGMSESQINQLNSTNQVMQTVPVYALTEGFVSEISFSEGNYVSTGTTLFLLSSFKSLWVEAQVYLPYLSYLKTGTEANFTFPSVSGKTISGKVIFIDPQVQSPERFILARFQINNPSEQIKPGMLANITLQTEVKKSLVLPLEAIIQDSKGANVWLLNKEGVFENKMVAIGIQNSRQIEIVDGLREGDIVVVTGAYLLNSEYIFKKGQIRWKVIRICRE
ncbi:MAG: efflux RND transporter periplasmic adaptor subunit [Bacteroidetes bacterium]|nr:efflux RND transporter periplasmic adaptor subunit [Bacteroidota bacterium]